jgi:hypothetical protein
LGDFTGSAWKILLVWLGRFYWVGLKVFLEGS